MTYGTALFASGYTKGTHSCRLPWLSLSPSKSVQSSRKRSPPSAALPTSTCDKGQTPSEHSAITRSISGCTGCRLIVRMVSAQPGRTICLPSAALPASTCDKGLSPSEHSASTRCISGCTGSGLIVRTVSAQPGRTRCLPSAALPAFTCDKGQSPSEHSAATRFQVALAVDSLSEWFRHSPAAQDACPQLHCQLPPVTKGRQVVSTTLSPEAFQVALTLNSSSPSILHSPAGLGPINTFPMWNHHVRLGPIKTFPMCNHHVETCKHLHL